MKPIINPLWIYLIDVVSNLKGYAIIIFGISAVVMVRCFICYTCNKEDFEAIDIERVITKISIICFILSFTLITIVPEKKTIYTMMVLEQVTPNNIKVVGEAGENIIDYITEKIDEVVNDK